MNGLTLRISGGGSKKTKNTFGFATVTIPETKTIGSATDNKEVQQFLEATSVDEQLTNLKNILNNCTDKSPDNNLVKFLVTVFLEAEVKHPLKCFLTRSITRSDSLQKPFTAALSEAIVALVTDSHSSYRSYVPVVGKVASCVENFPAGAAAVKDVDMQLAQYLKDGLTCTVQTLSETNCLSPTEKNEVFTLAHSILRLILYVAQKVAPGRAGQVHSMAADIRSCLQYLLFDEDVPMDTKSVCGIVFVTLYMLQNGPDSWVDILSGGADETVRSFLERAAGRLCLYSALATAVPPARLHAALVHDAPAVLLLAENVIAVGERMSTDATFNLAVARTLLQLSKGLGRGAGRLVRLLLAFVWAHLDHCMDSVRHLSAQTLANVVRYCARLDEEGDGSALDELFSSLHALDRRRKSYFVSVAALAAALPAAAVAHRAPRLVPELLASLRQQAVQASATTALETLLQRQSTAPPEVTYERWIVPIVRHAAGPLDCSELAVLEGLLTRVVKQDERVMDYILPHIREEAEGEEKLDLKCVLMLLSVARRAGAVRRWTDMVRPERLRDAAVSACEQTRVLLLGLVAESPRSTEVFAPDELELALHFLAYNANARAPNFRQLVLSLLKKLLKRLEDSYKAFERQRCEGREDYYVSFLERLRAQCFAGLLPGAGYGRRCVALHALAACERARLPQPRRWSEEYVERLLLHLDDSYESNKALALEVLQHCPLELLRDKRYSTSLELEDVLQQASSVKPTDCVSAAYKLCLLRDRLPERIAADSDGCEWRGVAEAASYALAARLAARLGGELAVCRAGVLQAARGAPMYGLLHCVRRLVDTTPARALGEDAAWAALVARLVELCVAVNDSVACVVNNSSPEGHLPMDMGGVLVSDHGNSGDVRLADGRPVTAQMVLLCAWRSVKEVSLLLGTLCSRLELGGRLLTVPQVLVIGEHFTRLLAETKHRGAFEQAYVGFTSLLARLWRCRDPGLHELPRRWLDELMAAIQSPHAQGKLCATRRSAGLPFMIQALVTTELQVRENPTCFHACMDTLLSLAGRGGAVGGATRTHCTNVLRALVRHAALRDAVAPHVGAAIRVALDGFDGTTWEERNSSTLLFSALMVRVFGVQRSRAAELCVRNRMTGRVFFLRYPELYDFLLGKLEDASRGGVALRPALYPVLLLLARLYPSALEGTVSNLKVVSFVPLVSRCARSADLRTRRLAAAALPPLVAPQLYISHLETLLRQLGDERIERNHCHGLLLQISGLAARRPDGLAAGGAADGLRTLLARSLWALRQPCYVIIDEYQRMVSLLLWKFEGLLDGDFLDRVTEAVDRLVFQSAASAAAAGRSLCLANGAYLLFIVLNVRGGDLRRAVLRCLAHDCYEVVLAALNYLLIMHRDVEPEDEFQEHLALVTREGVLETLHGPELVQLLGGVIRTARYLECTQKALRALTLSGDTQADLVRTKSAADGVDGDDLTDDVIIQKLLQYIEREHETCTHIYLRALSNLLTATLRAAEGTGARLLGAIRAMFACSWAGNGTATRAAVADFLDANIEALLALDLDDLDESEKFEYKATLFCTLCCLLEDDEAALSHRAAGLAWRAARRPPGDVTPARAAEELRALAAAAGGAGGDDAVALLTALALLDFRCQVLSTDEDGDECRVFDQNERYNAGLEDTVWSAACARRLQRLCGGGADGATGAVLNRVRHVAARPRYRPALEKLCDDNYSDFCGEPPANNTRVRLFISELNRTIEVSYELL